ncbi:SOS response-associated peptidase [Hyphomicrobium sp. DY-1]|uniref:SOS response-associated peptidase n=1 Tax=Hyphomicrobium sp. DY-1 TaxID=3075650 RepID=UPI0039C119DB
MDQNAGPDGLTEWSARTSIAIGPWDGEPAVCNLYSCLKGPDSIRRLFRAARASPGIPLSFPAIFPDTLAPVVSTAADGERELSMMRWGFPPPPKGNRPVTNVRNVTSSFWRAWLKPECRVLVPVTSFCEYTDSTPKVPHWFALAETRPLFAFAGIWRPWTGTRKGETGEHRLYSFLTTESNGVVGPIHQKAMPVLLTTEAEFDAWLTAPTEEAIFGCKGRWLTMR